MPVGIRLIIIYQIATIFYRKIQNHPCSAEIPDLCP